ncbi:MAG: efflux RND transporter periplasmic adaptor subunit [Acidobacteriales bacterium]|nr:efflux RND transporter periplasmic adaptor subunit [Terriglobales bacterium]
MNNGRLIWLVLLAAVWAPVGCDRKTSGPRADSPVPAVVQMDPNRVNLAPDSPQLSRLQTGAVELAEVPVDPVTSPGKVEANPNRTAHVLLPVAGRVRSVEVRIGDYVKQGQTLLTVESPDVDAAISAYMQAQAAVTQARAALVKAQADADRARDLFEHRAVAQKEVLNAEALLAQSKAALDQALAGGEQCRRRLQILGVRPGQFGQSVAVLAPISGKILDMSVVPGEYRNDTSSPLVTIADLGSVWVTADVPETSIRYIQLGERLDVDFEAYPGESFRGRVTRIADVVDPQTRTIKVRAEIANRDGRFRPEMFCRIRHSEALERKPVVPASAVVMQEGKNVVWRLMAPGSFERVAVQTGVHMGDRVAILSGLSAGDKVVVDGTMLLKTN